MYYKPLFPLSPNQIEVVFVIGSQIMGPIMSILSIQENGHQAPILDFTSNLKSPLTHLEILSCVSKRAYEASQDIVKNATIYS